VTWKQLVPSKEIGQRIKIVQKKMLRAGLNAALIVQRVDLFYLTGTAQNAYLYIPAEGSPLLMVKKYYPRATLESAIAQIVQLKSVKNLPNMIVDHYGELPKNLGLEMDVLPYREFHFLKSLFPQQDLKDISPLILEARAIKSDWEIEQLKNAAIRSEKCFGPAIEHACTRKHPVKIASTVQTRARILGHGAKIRMRYHRERAIPFTIKFWPSVNSETPELHNARLVEMDFKWVFNGYHLHETRLLRLWNLSPAITKAAQNLLQIHDHVIQEARPGVTAQELYMKAQTKAIALGYPNALVGLDPRNRPSPTAPIGHGIGLELREPPFITKANQTVLTPNMVLAIHPALMLGRELAISMCSVMRITTNGSEYISKVSNKVFEAL